MKRSSCLKGFILYSYIFFLPERVHEEASLFIRHNLREQIKAVLCRSAFFSILTSLSLQDCLQSQDCFWKIPFRVLLYLSKSMIYP